MHLDHRPTILIGPNGAGKSTLLRLMARQLRPHGGAVTGTTAVGFSAQHTVSLPGFTVAEQARYASWLAGVPRSLAHHEASRALALTELAELAERPATQLSGGELARLGIACALASSPRLVLLDEPTASLDPLARLSVTAVLEALVRDNIGVVVSSHTATDVGPPFERLLVLDQGALEFDGTVEEFFIMPHQNRVVLELAKALRGR